jgi:DNA-directed RNA polymerase specialized sigma24 family protein
MKKEINCFINRNYYELKKITKKITGNHELTEDLLHEVLLQILNKDEVKLKSFDDKSITYYFVSILRINWISKTSPFHYKIRKNNENLKSFDYNMEITEEQYDWEREHLIQMMEISYTELNFFQKGLLELYLVLGSVNKVAQQTEIPKSSVIKQIRKAKDIIKQNTLNRIKDGM